MSITGRTASGRERTGRGSTTLIGAVSSRTTTSVRNVREELSGQHGPEDRVWSERQQLPLDRRAHVGGGEAHGWSLSPLLHAAQRQLAGEKGISNGVHRR